MKFHGKEGKLKLFNIRIKRARLVYERLYEWDRERERMKEKL